MNEVQIAYIKEHFSYDPKIGLMLKGKPSKAKQINLPDGKRVRAKCLAWWFATGKWAETVRVIDGDQSNTKFENLTDTLKGPRGENANNVPTISLAFVKDKWVLTTHGKSQVFKKYVDAKSALDEVYYTMDKLIQN